MDDVNQIESPTDFNLAATLDIDAMPISIGSPIPLEKQRTLEAEDSLNAIAKPRIDSRMVIQENRDSDLHPEVKKA